MKVDTGALTPPEEIEVIRGYVLQNQDGELVIVTNEDSVVNLEDGVLQTLDEYRQYNTFADVTKQVKIVSCQ